MHPKQWMTSATGICFPALPMLSIVKQRAKANHEICAIPHNQPQI